MEIEGTQYFKEKFEELKENIEKLPENQVQILRVLAKEKEWYKARRLLSASYEEYVDQHGMVYSSPEKMLGYINKGGTIDELRISCVQVIAFHKVVKVLDRFMELHGHCSCEAKEK